MCMYIVCVRVYERPLICVSVCVCVCACRHPASCVSVCICLFVFGPFCLPSRSSWEGVELCERVQGVVVRQRAPTACLHCKCLSPVVSERQSFTTSPGGGRGLSTQPQPQPQPQPLLIALLLGYLAPGLLGFGLGGLY